MSDREHLSLGNGISVRIYSDGDIGIIQSYTEIMQCNIEDIDNIKRYFDGIHPRIPMPDEDGVLSGEAAKVRVGSIAIICLQKSSSDQIDSLILELDKYEITLKRK